MTDEQLGRQWCQRNGKQPDYRPWHQRPDRPWRWVNDDGPVYALPHPLWHSLYATAGVSRFDTEAAAYAAVGAALCELQQRAKEIAEVLKGVPQ